MCYALNSVFHQNSSLKLSSASFPYKDIIGPVQLFEINANWTEQNW